MDEAHCFLRTFPEMKMIWRICIHFDKLYFCFCRFPVECIMSTSTPCAELWESYTALQRYCRDNCPGVFWHSTLIDNRDEVVSNFTYMWCDICAYWLTGVSGEEKCQIVQSGSSDESVQKPLLHPWLLLLGECCVLLPQWGLLWHHPPAGHLHGRGVWDPGLTHVHGCFVFLSIRLVFFLFLQLLEKGIPSMQHTLLQIVYSLLSHMDLSGIHAKPFNVQVLKTIETFIQVRF